MNKAEVTAIYAIRDRYGVGCAVNPSDFERLLAIYRQDPFRDASQVVQIVISINLYHTIGFTAILMDGSVDTFSPYGILKPQSTSTKVRYALRKALRPQIPFQPGMHVHHIIEFEELVQQWYKERAIADKDVLVDHHHHIMLNKAQEADWQAFHAAHAQYAIVTPAAHKLIHKN